MLWLKALHIIFMVTWFAGLFYLPRLFVYHAQSTDRVSLERFKLMERKLFFGIMAPGAVLTVLFGTWLWLGYGFSGGWLVVKHGRNRHGHVFYRWLNEFPVLILVAAVLLVVLKPF
jgi:putative membrane protein